MHLDATATVLRLNAASPLYYGKALFWVHTASRKNKSNVYVSHWLAVLTSWPFLMFCDISFLLKSLHYAIRTVMNEVCKEELDNLGMRGWYQTIVTDYGSNIVSAFDRHRGWGWQRYGCQLLHNVVMGSIQVIKNMSHIGKHTLARRIKRALDW